MVSKQDLFMFFNRLDDILVSVNGITKLGQICIIGDAAMLVGYYNLNNPCRQVDTVDLIVRGAFNDRYKKPLMDGIAATEKALSVASGTYSEKWLEKPYGSVNYVFSSYNYVYHPVLISQYRCFDMYVMSPEAYLAYKLARGNEGDVEDVLKACEGKISYLGLQGISIFIKSVYEDRTHEQNFTSLLVPTIDSAVVAAHPEFEGCWWQNKTTYSETFLNPILRNKYGSDFDRKVKLLYAKEIKKYMKKVTSGGNRFSKFFK